MTTRNICFYINWYFLFSPTKIKINLTQCIPATLAHLPKSFTRCQDEWQILVLFMSHLLLSWAKEIWEIGHFQMMRGLTSQNKPLIRLFSFFFFLSSLQTWNARTSSHPAKKVTFWSRKEQLGDWRPRRNAEEAVPVIASLKTSCFVCAGVIKQLEFYITLVKINKEHIWVSHRFSH